MSTCAAKKRLSEVKAKREAAAAAEDAKHAAKMAERRGALRAERSDLHAQKAPRQRRPSVLEQEHEAGGHLDIRLDRSWIDGNPKSGCG